MKDNRFPTYEQLQEGWIKMQAERDLLKAAVAVDLTRIDDLEKALKKLLFAARTSGGIAGQDEFLCKACRHAEFILRSAEEVAERCHKCIVCGQGPREVPDRESMSKAKKVCRPCHGKRLLGDLRDIVDLSKQRRQL